MHIKNTPIQTVLAEWSTVTGIPVELDSSLNHKITLTGEHSEESMIEFLGRGLSIIKTRSRKAGCPRSTLKEIVIVKKGGDSEPEMLRFLPRPSRKNLVIHDMEAYVLKYAYSGSRKNRMTREQQKLFLKTRKRLRKEGKLNEY